MTTANNQTLTYDAINRLASATGNYGTIGSITYDSNSNRKTYGSTSFTVPATSDKISAAGSSSISYSSTGNVTAYGSYSFTYNKANQVASSTVSSQSYTYDAFGQRLSNKYGTNSPILYAYDQAGNRIAEANNPGEIDYAWLDGFPVSIIVPSSSAVYAVHTDRLGTQQKVTDSTKAVVWNYTYSPNGVLSGSGSLTTYLRYPGQAYDNANDNHNGYRDYMQSTGRYMQVDPIGLAGGVNPYGYALNNTYSYTDPLGLNTQIVVGFGGTVAAFIPALGGGVSLGVFVPDDPRKLSDYQLILGAQANAMIGVGAYAGYGYSFSQSHSDGMLNYGFSGGIYLYGEADAEIGPSISVSIQKPGNTYGLVCTANDTAPLIKTYSSPIGKPAEGFGLFAG